MNEQRDIAPHGRRASRTGRLLEILLWGLGLVCLTSWMLARAQVARTQEAAFAMAAAEWAVPRADEPDTASWSPQRLARYEQARQLGTESAPIALLTIAATGIRVAVLDGTSSHTLNLGAGRIPGTAYPGDTGNLGIAGHRDGFFRGLKDIAAGHEIVLTHAGGEDRYVVEDFFITDPDDVSVLEPTAEPVLTLVTCYPFYFVGNAPRRFIVKATLAPGASET